MVVFPSLKSQRLHILVESSESLPLASQLAKQAVSHSSKSMHSLSQEAYASKKKSKKQPTKTVKTTKKKRFQRPKWLRSAGENNLPRLKRAHSFTSDPDFADDERESQVNHNTDKSTSPNTDNTVLASPVSPLLTGLDHVSPSEAQFSLEVWKLLSVRSLLRYLFISIARNGNPDTLYHYLPTDTAKNAIDKKKHHATAHQKLRAQKSSLLKLGAHNVAVIARLISKIWGSIKELSVRLRDAAKRKATFTTKSDGEEILQGDNSTIDSPVVAPCTENRTDDAITVGPQTCADLSDSKGSSKQVSFCFAPSQTEDEEPQAYTTWRAEQNRHSDEIIRQIDDIIVNIAEIDPLNESPQLNFAGFQTSPEISPIDLNLSAQCKNEHEREAPEVSEEPLSTGFDNIPALPQSITEKDSSQTQPINTDFFRRSLGNRNLFVFSNVVTVSGLLKTDTASDELQDPIFENKQQNTQAHYEFIHNQMPSIVEGSDSRHVLASIHLKPETSDSVGFKQVFDSVGSAEDKLRQNQVSTPLLTISEIDEREQYIDAPLRVKFLEAITEEEDETIFQ
ncbi:hypothetical protein JCM33374_g6061 [Metschnikowia sp. JCM 33374]|nr:hypothetical protein JCM33374_g6061 [Metschnikowia sp. JCM 33374]